jgi:putative transposase
MKANPVTVLFEVMQVSRSGLYHCLQSVDGPGHRLSEKALEERGMAIFKQPRGSCGSRSGMLGQLRLEGYQIGRYMVRRLMRQLGLKVKRP